MANPYYGILCSHVKAIPLKNNNGKHFISQKEKKGCGERDRDRNRGLWEGVKLEDGTVEDNGM